MVLDRKYEAFYDQFSPEMKKAIALKTYSQQVDQIMTSLGRPSSQDPPQARHIGTSVTVTIPVYWPAATLNFIVSWNAAGQIQEPGFARPKPACRALMRLQRPAVPAHFLLPISRLARRPGNCPAR